MVLASQDLGDHECDLGDLPIAPGAWTEVDEGYVNELCQGLHGQPLPATSSHPAATNGHLDESMYHPDGSGLLHEWVSTATEATATATATHAAHAVAAKSAAPAPATATATATATQRHDGHEDFSPLSKVTVMAMRSSTSPLAYGVDASPNSKLTLRSVRTQPVPAGLQGRFPSKADMAAQVKRVLLTCQEKDKDGTTICCAHKVEEDGKNGNRLSYVCTGKECAFKVVARGTDGCYSVCPRASCFTHTSGCCSKPEVGVHCIFDPEILAEIQSYGNYRDALAFSLRSQSTRC